MTIAAPAAVSARAAWRFFDTEVVGVRRLSPSFVRVTLGGPDLGDFADNGLDQRFKLVLPDAGGGYATLPRHEDWYAEWRRLDAERRNAIRTYTVRAVRPERREVDVDVVLHGDTGPATRFAARAAVGDRLVVLGPDAGWREPHGGLEFRPPAGHAGPTLLVGDATAVPAVLTILEQLPTDAAGEAVLDVPDCVDVLDAVRPPGVRLSWLVGGGSGGLLDAVDGALDRIAPHALRTAASVSASATTAPSAPVSAADDEEPFWEVPDSPSGGAGVYAWVAAESSVVAAIRRHLVGTRGLDRRAVAFMGYWREGRPSG